MNFESTVLDGGSRWGSTEEMNISGINGNKYRYEDECDDDSLRISDSHKGNEIANLDMNHVNGVNNPHSPQISKQSLLIEESYNQHPTKVLRPNIRQL
jgi:hypothetical protein